VPVIRDAYELSPEGLATRIEDLAERARSKQLSPDEVSGGTFTITNPGAFGALLATPIINQPQVAILDLEAVVKRPVVVTDADGRDSIAVRPMAYLCMSWDHRAPERQPGHSSPKIFTTNRPETVEDDGAQSIRRDAR
jgi:pyruvate/2-oxoglutarate dehydrogenase complex dihydrolipoamide acyltransferase (E2) component